MPRKLQIYINLIALVLLILAGLDNLFRFNILTKDGLSLIIFTVTVFILVTTFLELTLKHKEEN